MNIFTDYIQNLEKALDANDGEAILSESNNYIKNYFEKGFKTFSYINESHLGETESRSSILLPSLKKFASNQGLTINFDQQLGLHPDFAYLKGTTNTENHYIISAFIDIKGSTNLFKRYSPKKVLVINDLIQKAAIHICVMFGGYIQRLQGDGLFIYFGGKNIPEIKAINQVLLATSVFSFFVKEELKSILEDRGINGIYTRIGIDLGHKKDVVWSDAGIDRISEVTTCSLHTSLAPKMQSNAVSNGIVVGDNLRKLDVENADIMTPVCHRTSDENDRYIFQISDKKFFYTQYDFGWLKFLKRQKFIATNLNGGITFIEKGENNNSPLDDLKVIASNNKPYLKGQ
jgi:class 3 adenylate cyclase